MAQREAAKVFVRQVKPLLSLDQIEAQRRVRNLYRAWYRQIPIIVHDFHIPKTEKQCYAKLREEFDKHKDVKDIRLIDMLIIKGQMELKEIVNKWKQECHLMMYFKDTVEPKPKDFLSKFMSGSD
ncbi:NADH dehydrogenase [ubiquinone] 1 alpha subcomplex subunit 6-like [Macrosteles quadrilineatus]|uniref:NADH dehydrogenase [ubiquinone] 1 alpha subcomplex subunit 6-like n=1 Tax=Macrosteles quadrilineatus TaxID=74068 RepID=UPI0023E2F8CC|nr:NADH dehydrogenase [ubiquinone] 1 alpha subcomplex subunit 6-like [Macrosteles quadrilineatus]XP_054290221.1 NADH dehydrogenase [ubiquinone] 1 alpha subcomplex subunit 6-like [Macrosteles quadrilineatus]